MIRYAAATPTRLHAGLAPGDEIVLLNTVSPAGPHVACIVTGDTDGQPGGLLHELKLQGGDLFIAVDLGSCRWQLLEPDGPDAAVAVSPEHTERGTSPDTPSPNRTERGSPPGRHKVAGITAFDHQARPSRSN